MPRSLRSATREDADAIHAIYAPIVRHSAISFEIEPPSVDEMAQRITTITADYPWLVTIVDDAVAGYAYANAFRARPAYRATAEVSIAIAPAYRGKGLALPLYEALLDDLARRNCHSAVAVIAMPNDASVALHARAGFTRVGVLREVGY
ncbi:MAG TPA: GNAT family N-acetyltransferase, partial [Thermoanaerobaculia bacterium]